MRDYYWILSCILVSQVVVLQNLLGCVPRSDLVAATDDGVGAFEGFRGVFPQGSRSLAGFQQMVEDMQVYCGIAAGSPTAQVLSVKVVEAVVKRLESAGLDDLRGALCLVQREVVVVVEPTEKRVDCDGFPDLSPVNEGKM